MRDGRHIHRCTDLNFRPLGAQVTCILNVKALVRSIKPAPLMESPLWNPNFVISSLPTPPLGGIIKNDLIVDMGICYM